MPTGRCMKPRGHAAGGGVRGTLRYLIRAKTTANAMLPTLLDEIYTGLSLATPTAPTTTR
jgi:hypothetical protein